MQIFVLLYHLNCFDKIAVWWVVTPCSSETAQCFAGIYRLYLHNRRVEFYITTDGQPASLSWNKAPFWGLRPDLYYCLTVAGFWFGAPFLTRGRVCPLQLLLALASAVIFGSESRRARGHILLSQIRDFPFHRLLRLAGSRWRYSTPPPHGYHDRRVSQKVNQQEAGGLSPNNTRNRRLFNQLRESFGSNEDQEGWSLHRDVYYKLQPQLGWSLIKVPFKNELS
jgi:hypothetical protein